MAGRQRRTRLRVDDDGVRTVEPTGVRREVWLLLLALALVAAAVLVLVRPVVRQDEDDTAQPDERPAVASQSGAQRLAPRPAGPRRPEPLTRVVPPPAAGEPEAAQIDDGGGAVAPERRAEAATGDEPTGIALFPPPGTKPIKAGIIVPEDFELPPGYVRHYQATDDGQRVPPILMFHPDYRPVDARGEPIPLPEDRVVPPDMAPPGMPVELLVPPENVVPMLEEPPADAPPAR